LYFSGSSFGFSLYTLQASAFVFGFFRGGGGGGEEGG